MSGVARHSPRHQNGPFARALDPLEDARDALLRGVPADQVAAQFLDLAVRRHRLSALRQAFAEEGVLPAFDQALATLGQRQSP